jgi:hypothetical protein
VALPPKYARHLLAGLGFRDHIWCVGSFVDTV